MLRWRKYKLLQILLISIGLMIVLLNFKYRAELDKLDQLDQPDILPYRVKLREIQGQLVWSVHNVSVGLPISHIRDLGENKSRVLLVIIVSTAPLRRERREAIRQTWWKHCKTEEVACHFFTDGQVVNKKIQKNMWDEISLYGDMEFQPLLGGTEFGLRFLYHAKWSSANYNFQYFLRVDDDYFVCLKKLLNELPLRPKENLVWGNFHCQANITWIDESFMVFSRDVINKFLTQDARRMLCHPHADQQISIWLNNISDRVFFHDDRLNHLVTDSFDWQARDVCDKYMGIHRAFASRMLQLGKESGDGAKEVPPVANFSAFCEFDTFDHKAFEPGSYFFEPKPCIENVLWVKKHRLWIGSEGKVNS